MRAREIGSCLHKSPESNGSYRSIFSSRWPDPIRGDYPPLAECSPLSPATEFNPVTSSLELRLLGPHKRRQLKDMQGDFDLKTVSLPRVLPSTDDCLDSVLLISPFLL
ncbi:hypothetical protein BaRGS_00024175, partial [Batillaria attramentaria]